MILKLRTFYKSLRSRYDSSASLIRRGLNSFIINFFGLFLNFVRGVILARLLGVVEYGNYSFVIAIVAFFMVPVHGGQLILVTRQTAAYQARLDVARLRGLWQRQMQWGIGYGIIVAVIFTGIVTIQEKVGRIVILPDGVHERLLYAIPLFLVLPFAHFLTAALNGLQHTNEGQIPIKIIQPMVFICLLVTTSLGTNKAINADGALIFMTISACGAVATGYYWLRRHQPKDLNRVFPAYEIKVWLKSLLPLISIGVVAAINSQADVLMLGFLSSTADVGIYRIASNISALVVFSLFAVNVVIAPRIADLYIQRKSQELQRMLTKSARVILIGAIAVGLPFIFFGEKIIVYVFGAQFASSYKPLLILCIGQLVSAAAGSVNIILNMTGHEREVLVGICAAACVNVLFNLFLIPSFGASGAASARAASIVVSNVMLLYFVRIRVGLDSTALGRL